MIMEIRVKVRSGMKKNSIEELPDGRLCAAVTAPRKEGKANTAVRLLVAEHFGVNVDRVHITKGQQQATKTLIVR